MVTEEATVTRENPNFTFLETHCSTARIIALQGGTRSGKTYSAIRFLIWLCVHYSGLTISIVRKTFPALSATALRDFQEVLKDAELYDEANESKPSGYYEYSLGENLVEFFSVDNQQKVRGRKRHILYINEANDLTLEEFRQLAFRTEGLIIIDYNPSDPESYIYEHVLTRQDCQMLVSTYQDNPFLPQSIVDEIELLKDADEEYWKVFGQGERGNSSGIILSHYHICLRQSYPTGKGETVYGLDFGYSAPSALVEATLYDEAVYLKQLIYRRKLTNPELIQAVIAAGVPFDAVIYCDAAEPDRIEEFQKAGFYNAVAAIKTIKPGLDSMRSRPLYIHEESKELISEIKGYRYKKDKATGDNTDEPVAVADHAIDAGRYAVFNHWHKTVVTGTARYSRPSTKAMRL